MTKAFGPDKNSMLDGIQFFSGGDIAKEMPRNKGKAAKAAQVEVSLWTGPRQRHEPDVRLVSLRSIWGPPSQQPSPMLPRWVGDLAPLIVRPLLYSKPAKCCFQMIYNRKHVASFGDHI